MKTIAIQAVMHFLLLFAVYPVLDMIYLLNAWNSETNQHVLRGESKVDPILLCTICWIFHKYYVDVQIRAGTRIIMGDFSVQIPYN